MTVSGSTSAEALIPGNPTQIQQAIDTLSSGVDPARQIQTAWGSMQIPGWSGRAANAWKPFTPREAAYVGKTVTAMSMAAAALREYQTAFNVARAEAAAAILEAQAAEQATANAQTAYRDAVKKAADAKPGSPEAKPPTYTDPGAAPLANAQARLDGARTNLDTAGNTAAGIITTAGNMTSNVRPTITGAGHVKPTVKSSPKGNPLDYLKVFLGAAWDSVTDLAGFLLRVNPTGSAFDKLALAKAGPEAIKARKEENEAITDALNSDTSEFIKNLLLQLLKDFAATDYWKDHPAEAMGRVRFGALSLFLPFGGPLLKAGKGAKAGSAAGKAARNGSKAGKSVTNGSKGSNSSGGGKVTTQPDKNNPKTTDAPKNKSNGSTNVPNLKETSERVADGHAFDKHVVKKGEFPGITTREQFAKLIEDVVKNGEVRTLNDGRSAYWKDGTVVILDPGNRDGGTVFRPSDGYSYFLDMK